MSEPEIGKRSRSKDSAINPSRRKIYIKERLPAVVAEMKSLADERKELLAKRKDAQPDERKQINRRWNFVAERLNVLRSERASLMSERDGIPLQRESARAQEVEE